MADFFGSIWWFIVALGLLVAFHEFGHFWVARRMGVKVLRFSVGFGQALWSRNGKDGTEYVLAAIPLGGYVKMLDEREAPVASSELDGAFNRKPLGARAAIVAAGPIFNLVFTIAAFWLMFMVGVPEVRAVFDAPAGIAADAGMERGDQIVSVDGARTETLIQANIELLPFALDRKPVDVTVVDGSGISRDLTLRLDRLGDDFREEELLEFVGLDIWSPRVEPVVGGLVEGGAAEAAGLEAGDRVLQIGDTVIDDWQDLGVAIQAQAGDGRALAVEIDRAGERRLERIVPRRESPEQPFLIGIAPPELAASERATGERLFTVVRHGPVQSIGEALNETWRMTTATLGLMRRMVTGEASLSNLSGPISIAQFANDHAQAGFGRFLFFLAILSLSLAILNFLPIPLLDGGHLMYYFIEWIKGSPVSEQTQIVGQYIGLTALACLVTLTFYNDILRLLD
ncbi:MAG: RIP metalloprotease RseP [Pseudomonadota bacterium]